MDPRGSLNKFKELLSANRPKQEIDQFLNKAPGVVNQMDEKDGSSGLTYAIINNKNNIDVLDSILKAKDLNLPLLCMLGQHPLLTSARSGNTEAFNKLIPLLPPEYLNSKDKEGKTALMYAATSTACKAVDRTNMVTTLLEHKADIDLRARDNNENTALSLALNKNVNENVIKSILAGYKNENDLQADLKHPNKSGQTGEQLAELFGYDKFIQDRVAEIKAVNAEQKQADFKEEKSHHIDMQLPPSYSPPAEGPDGPPSYYDYEEPSPTYSEIDGEPDLDIESKVDGEPDLPDLNAEEPGSAAEEPGSDEGHRKPRGGM